MGEIILKKLRGKRRYYRSLLSKVSDYQLDLSDDHWYDMWHMHVDWYGRGNENQKARNTHLRALFMLFRNFQKQLDLTNRPYQVWVLVHEDSAEDAVYFHTPSENSDNFPMTFEASIADQESPTFLKEFADTSQDRFGHMFFEGKVMYIVYSKKHGIPPIG